MDGGQAVAAALAAGLPPAQLVAHLAQQIPGLAAAQHAQQQQQQAYQSQQSQPQQPTQSIPYFAWPPLQPSLHVPYFDFVQYRGVNLEASPSENPSGADLPVTDITTLRFFFNLGVQHARVTMLNQQLASLGATVSTTNTPPQALLAAQIAILQQQQQQIAQLTPAQLHQLSQQTAAQSQPQPTSLGAQIAQAALQPTTSTHPQLSAQQLSQAQQNLLLSRQQQLSGGIGGINMSVLQQQILRELPSSRPGIHPDISAMIRNQEALQQIQQQQQQQQAHAQAQQQAQAQRAHEAAMAQALQAQAQQAQMEAMVRAHNELIQQRQQAQLHAQALQQVQQVQQQRMAEERQREQNKMRTVGPPPTIGVAKARSPDVHTLAAVSAAASSVAAALNGGPRMPPLGAGGLIAAASQQHQPHVNGTGPATATVAPTIAIANPLSSTVTLGPPSSSSANSTVSGPSTSTASENSVNGNPAPSTPSSTESGKDVSDKEIMGYVGNAETLLLDHVLRTSATVRAQDNAELQQQILTAIQQAKRSKTPAEGGKGRDYRVDIAIQIMNKVPDFDVTNFIATCQSEEQARELASSLGVNIESKEEKQEMKREPSEPTNEAITPTTVPGEIVPPSSSLLAVSEMHFTEAFTRGQGLQAPSKTSTTTTPSVQKPSDQKTTTGTPTSASSTTVKLEEQQRKPSNEGDPPKPALAPMLMMNYLSSYLGKFKETLQHQGVGVNLDPNGRAIDYATRPVDPIFQKARQQLDSIREYRDPKSSPTEKDGDGAPRATATVTVTGSPIAINRQLLDTIAVSSLAPTERPQATASAPLKTNEEGSSPPVQDDKATLRAASAGPPSEKRPKIEGPAESSP